MTILSAVVEVAGEGQEEENTVPFAGRTRTTCASLAGQCNSAQTAKCFREQKLGLHAEQNVSSINSVITRVARGLLVRLDPSIHQETHPWV